MAPRLPGKARPFLWLAGVTLAILLALAGEARAGGERSTDLEKVDGSLLFVQNVGQFDARVRYQVRSGNQVLWLDEAGFWLTSLSEEGDSGTHLRFDLDLAGTGLRLEGLHPISTAVTYGGPDGYFPDVPVFTGVRYAGIRPGLNLELVGSGGEWAWRLTGEPAPGSEKLTLEIKGADSLRAPGNQVNLTSGRQTITLPPLHGATITQLDGSRLELDINEHSRTSAPPFAGGGTELLYGTYVGGTAWDEGRGIATDGAGNSFVTGYTESLIFPDEAGTFSPLHGIDVVLFKVNAGGTDLDYVIFFYTATLNAEDYGNAVAVDASGHAYVAGSTYSDDFCTYLGAVPGYDSDYNGNGDAYLLKALPDGSGLVYCTYLGGSDLDLSNALALDSSGRATIAGGTWSTDFPVSSGAYSTSHAGLRDVFAVRISADGLALEYGTYIGGAGQEEATALAVDSQHNSYVTGWTASSDYPTTPGSLDPAFNGGMWDAFVSKINSDGSDLTYSTFIGGAGEDRGKAIAVSANGEAFATGSTYSDDLPTTPGAFDGTFGGGTCTPQGCLDGFVYRLDQAGSAALYGTYLGGVNADEVLSIALDPFGRAHVAGFTMSASTFPTTSGAFDGSHNGGEDAFLTVFEGSGSSLAYSTFLGGGENDRALGIAVNAGAAVYLTGRTRSDNFPVTPDSFDPAHNADNDIFVAALTVPLPQPLFLPLLSAG